MGFVLPYLLVFLIRFVLVAVLLAGCKLDGLKNFTAKQIIKNARSFKIRVASSDEDNESSTDTDDSDSEDSDSEDSDSEDSEANEARKISISMSQIKSSNISCYNVNWFHINALFAETLPWVLLAVFVDLPLSLKYLRLYVHLGSNPNTQDNRKKYRFSGHFFIATNIISTIEIIIMSIFCFAYTRMSTLKCGPTLADRAEKLHKIDQRCGYVTVNNSVPIECINLSQQSHPETMYQRINDELIVSNIIIIFVVLICLKVITSFIFYKVVWSNHLRVINKQKRNTALKIIALQDAREQDGR